MKKNNLSLDNVKFEVASEILAMKIALAISVKNEKEFKKLLTEQNKLYTYDEKIINKVLDVYGSEIKKTIKGRRLRMLSKELSEKYKISEFELNSIISKMKSIILENYQKDDKIPIAIFTGGQPGAGKSAIVLKSKIDLARKDKDSIVFDLDSYRGLFSKSLEIAQQYPEYFQTLTNPYSGKIMEELSNMAIEEGYSFIMEGTMGKSVYTLDVLLESGKKYNIIARLLAVSREESIISMFERYILMEEKSGFGRLTTIKDHDERYENFPNIALTLEDKGVEVEVYERTEDIKNPKLTYKTSNKKVNIYDSVAQAIEMGRETSRKKCYETYEERLEYINYKFKEFNVNEGLMEELNKLNEIFQYSPKKKEKKI